MNNSSYNNNNKNWLEFTKMHGLGNDFMVVDGVSQNIFLSPDKIKQLADRNFGIGFDQLLLVEPPYDPDQDFHYRIFNADGTEVEQCGNGARCFARFVRNKQLTNKNKIGVSTKAGKMTLFLEKDGRVTVNMGKPNFKPDQVPMQAQKQEKTYIVRTHDETFFIGAASFGNPHCVLDVKDVATYDVARVGALLESHERFPAKVNVGFMQIVDRRTINLRVFERGVGETLACGSGACAAVAIGIEQGKLDREVDVNLPGGQLRIKWPSNEQPLKMTGPAEVVFEGKVLI